MKNYNILFVIIGILLLMASCELDNFDEPSAALYGTILDNNGDPLQTTQGGGNMKLKMEELSWAGGDSTISIIPRNLNVKQDGTYENNKLFNGEYRITPIEGPFFPYSENGEIVNVSGSTKYDFSVIPYLNVEWVIEPYLNDSAFIRASIRFTRNSHDSIPMPDLNDCQLYISTTQYSGRNNYDDQLAAAPIEVTNDKEGTTIQLITGRAIKYVGATYYVRAGVSCKDQYKKYNYTDIKKVEVADDVVIPIFPERIGSSQLKCIKLDSDSPLDEGDGTQSMFDGEFKKKYETKKAEWPQTFTVDLGDTYNMDHFKMYTFMREDFFWRRHTVATFELYGWKGEDEPVDDMGNANWFKIGDYENTKPSGMPSTPEEYNTITDADKTAAEEGTVFEFPEEMENIRYLRFKITDTFDRTDKYGGDGSDGNRFTIDELHFWQMPTE